MSFFIHGFTVLLYNPLFNALVLLYLYLPGHDFGIAVIVLTILIRIVLYPLMVKSLKSQKALSELQPKMQEIQEKHKDNKEMQTKEMMALYQKEKINPFGGCLPLLIQLPILVALYQVFMKGMGPNTMHHLYGFIPNPGTINPSLLGLINLTEPNIVLAVLSGIIQFFQTKIMTPQKKNIQGKKDQMSQFSDLMQKEMLYFFPVFTVFILWKLPSAIGLYWIVTGLFSIYQQVLINRETKLKTI
jgi:YidC/Oxa1 family membrane protein insertase